MSKTPKHIQVWGGIGVCLVAVTGVAVWIQLASSISTDDAFIDADIVTVASGASGVVQQVYTHDNSRIIIGAPLLDIDDSDLKLQVETAGAALEAARAQASRDLPTGSVDTRVARATEREAASRLALARLSLSRAHITAPVSGFIAHRLVSVGDSVHLNQPVLAIVADHPWITANFKETDLGHLHVGDRADVRIDAYPDLKMTAHIDSFQHGSGGVFSLLPPENASGNFVKVVQRVPVKLVIDNGSDPRLFPGLSIRLRVHVR